MSYLYCLSSVYTDQHGTKKLGISMHLVSRMYVYNTGDCPGIDLEKRYDMIWQVNASSKTELLAIEHHVHSHFQSQQIKRKT